jgi:hypothetical protein
LTRRSATVKLPPLRAIFQLLCMEWKVPYDKFTPNVPRASHLAGSDLFLGGT